MSDNNDVAVQSTPNDISNDQMESFFKEAQQEEANYSDNPNDNQEIDHEESKSLLNDEATDEQSDREELTAEDAELSDEDGREERPDKQLSSDERHEKSYKIALKEERELRKTMQQELAEQRETAKKLSEAFNKLVSAANPEKQPEQQQIPDYDEDPIGHMKAKLEMADQRIERLSQTEAQIRQSQIDQQNMNQFVQDYRAKAGEFSTEHPDFNDAYTYLRKDLHDEYMIQGLTEDQADERLASEELQFAAQTMTNRQNPAKIMYELAKRRGFKASANQPDKAKEGLEKLSRMERGVKASRSINGKGVSPNNRMTLEEIAQLDDDAFDEAWDDVLKLG